MTLLELVLVLALLVVVTSLAIPVVDDAFASVKLRQAGDQVLAVWGAARRDAIDEGVIRQFLFLRGEGRYRVDVWAKNPERDLASTSAPTGLPQSGAGGAQDQAEDLTPAASLVEGVLPDTIVFDEGERMVEGEGSQQDALLQLQGAEGEWSEPILFFPDGATSDASVVLVNLRKQCQRLTLRGFTGARRASVVMDRAELEKSHAR